MTSRQERRQNESKNAKKSGGNPWLLRGGAAIVVIAIAIVAFIALSPDDSSDGVDGDALVMGGSLIGDPNAPVTLVEFGDFQ